MKDFNYKELPEKEKRKLQEKFHENEMNYFSSFAYEAGTIKEKDMEDLNKAIDKRISGSKPKLYRNLFISLGSAIILGTTFFFIWQHNNKAGSKKIGDIIITVPQVNNRNEVEEAEVRSTENTVTEKVTEKEHFNISESGEHLNLSGPMENMELKDINSIDVKTVTTTEPEEILNYIPNSSVIYIHDLKIADYKGYYFKNSDNIDIRDNGLSAQFSNKEETNTLSKRIEDKDYYAHEIIKDAMEAFHKKQYAAAIELLDVLNRYNKDDVNTQFYIGMSYFYLGNYTKAIKFLESSERNSNNVFLQESEFYLALSTKKSGKTEEAKTLFRKIASQKLFYADRAAQELN